MKYAIRLGVGLFLIVGGAAISQAQFGGRVELRKKRRIATMAVAGTPSAKGSIHIAAGRTTSFMWTVTDSHGYRWDISNNGTVNDGSNDAYDGGMRLQVNGSDFSSGGSGRLSADGREVEIGPWRYAGLAISRRIFVNTKSGYCRWIDIFENSTGAAITVSLRYYSNMGEPSNQTHTTSGGTNITAKDWGIVTAGSASSSSRPAIVHVFAAPGAKFKPQFRFTRGSDNLHCDAAIKVPAGKAVALCFFEAQRRPYGQAVKFLNEFKPARELRLVPPPLRRILLNMTSATLTLGGIELKRSDQTDLLILRNGNEIRGRLVTERYVLRTDFGQVTIPAERVIGLLSRSAESNRVHLVIAGGQVIAGELTSGPVAIKLAGGETVLEIPPKGLDQAAYRISPEKPESIAITDSLAVFRSGARLAFDDAETTFKFLTPHGLLSLAAGDLRSIEMDIPAGGLHRAVFRNGSTVAGLFADDNVRLKLKFGSTELATGGSAELAAGSSATEVSRQRLKRFVFASGPIESKGLARLTLRNTDVIFGRFTDEKWTVRGKFGSVAVAPSDVAAAEFNAAGLGQVKLTMRNGTELSGKLADDYVNFRIEPGPALKIFVGHIASITGAAAATTKPTGRTSRVPSAEERAGSNAEINRLRERLAKLHAERAAVDAQSNKIRAVLANNPNPRMLAELQARLAVLEKMRAAMKDREEKLKKVLAEASLRGSRS